MATFTVTNLNDSGTGSLRDIITQANATAGTDSIVFQSGLSGTLTLSTGELLIDDSVSISGPGITIDGNDSSRIFYVYDSASTLDVTFTGLTLTGGSTTDGGGAIASYGENITLTDMIISGNTSEDGGGGISVEDASLTIQNSQIIDNLAADYEEGGGIYFRGTGPDQVLSIANSTISGNIAFDDGAGIYARLYDGSSLTVLSSDISGNQAKDGSGGGIAVRAFNSDVTIGNSTLSDNEADYTGGALSFWDGFGGASTGSSLNIYNSDFYNNEGGAGTITAYFYNNTLGAVNTFDLVDSQVENNIAETGSGGVVLFDRTTDGLDANIQNSVITGNEIVFPNLYGSYYSGGGGGVSFNSYYGNGVLNILDSIITDNAGDDGDVDLSNFEFPNLNKGTINVTNSLIENPEANAINGTVSGLTTGLEANTVSLAVSPAIVGEGGTALVYTFTRTGPTTQGLTVNFEYSGTATLNTDFTQAGAASFANGTGTVTFAAGASAATVTLTILTDTVADDEETVTLSISNGSYLIGEIEATGTILDDAATGLTAAPIDFTTKKKQKGIKDKGGKQDDELKGTGKDDTLKGNSGDDTINGKGGKDKIYGDAGDDDLKGSGGNDLMEGSTGNDTMLGGNGNDQISGGEGSDTLTGQGGSDLIIGGLGSDTLSGGSEVDTFVFNSLAEGIDTITDFAGDLIDLRGILSGSQYSAVNNYQKFLDYVELVQVGANTELRIDTDGSGSGTAFSTIALLNNVTATSLTASNFIVG